MLTKEINDPEICVIGRCDASTGIGTIAYAACELLARNYSVGIFPIEEDLRRKKFIQLSNGREILVCKDLKRIKVFFYTDVLWNGPAHHNFLLVPEHGLKFAHIAYDSDEFPPMWVKILNHRFDGLLVTSPYLKKVARTSGVEIPIAVLPIALDIEPLLVRPFTQFNPTKIRFGSVVAFHTRKSIEVLIDAFNNVFADREDVELLLHSNLNIGDNFLRVSNKIKHLNVENIIVSHWQLSSREKDDLMESIDIFVNCSRGEGYSVGAREAMALGKTLVLSDVGAHKDLAGISGVFMIPATISVPARYPEIDNLVFGEQQVTQASDIAHALLQAYNYVASGQNKITAIERRQFAANFSFSRLSTSYAEIINPKIRDFRANVRQPIHVNITEELRNKVEQHVGERCENLSDKNRIVIPAHDGGFFSVFNVFMSHLVWELQNNRCHLVVPDWDVGRMQERLGKNKFTSFCYGQPEDGNIWLKLFEPLYGLNDAQMNDPRFIYHNALTVTDQDYFNEKREPLLTYVNAYKLYKSKNFQNFRWQYHNIYKSHIRLRPAFQQELHEFIKHNFTEKFMLAAHVKHPSHVMEQPQGVIAGTELFIEKINFELDKRHLLNSTNWRIFLATDQDRVVDQFKNHFGDRVIYFADVRRTRHSEDDVYDKLPADLKSQEGFQVQHLVASAKENWSTQMAWEVVRDAIAMSQCNVLFHVVSNVATAASYINPGLELIFCE